MGYFVNVIAKPGCEDQINELWHAAFGEDYLVMTGDRIARGIRDLQTNPEVKHLAWVRTEADWNDIYPIFARGKGQVFLAPIDEDVADDEITDVHESLEQLQKKVAWLQAHRMLFSEIRNLQDAVDALGLDYAFDGYENGREVVYYRPDFARLPVEAKNSVYQRCLEIDAPDLWERFLTWRDNPTLENWTELRSRLIPTGTIGGESIWQLCEQMHCQRTGERRTLAGTYQDGKMPPMTDVVRAILNRPDVQGTPQNGQ